MKSSLVLKVQYRAHIHPPFQNLSSLKASKTTMIFRHASKAKRVALPPALPLPPPPPESILNMPALTSALSTISKFWKTIPSFVRALINPRDLALFVVFYFLHKKVLLILYSMQIKFMKAMANRGKAMNIKSFEQSWLGFLEPRLKVLTRLLAGLYIANGAVGGLAHLGIFVRPGLQDFVSTIVAILYSGYFIDELKRFYLPVLWPELQEDKRKAFIYNRTTSVLTWLLISLGLLQVTSTFLRIPLASTLAFGGAGGIAFGFASKGIFENFFGGLMLLLSEPFVPGDMVHFEYGGAVMEGRVERVGWYQTRLRGRDTRPTYIPNNVFLQNLVTNMDRITHRKFEHSFFMPFQDFSKVSPALNSIKAALKELPKVDLLSPFRVYLVGYGDWGFQISIVLYFATKSLDEYLFLQQMALLEVGRVIHEAGSEIACPAYTVDFVQRRQQTNQSTAALATMTSTSLQQPKPGLQKQGMDSSDVNGKNDILYSTKVSVPQKPRSSSNF